MRPASPQIPDLESWAKARWSLDPAANEQSLDMLDTVSYPGDRSSWTDRTHRLQKRNRTRAENIRRGQYSKMRLTAAYEAFQRLYADQKVMKRESEARKAFAALFRACPKLDRVIMTMMNELRVQSASTMERAFQEGMVSPFSDHPIYYIGTHALESLLLGVHDSGRTLRSLAVQPNSHASFEMRPEVAAKVYEVVGGLSELHIGMMAVFEDDWGELDEGLMSRVMFDLEHAKVAEFVAQGAKLTSLSIGAPEIFDRRPRVPLRYLVGDTRLHVLQTLKLRWFTATEAELHTLLVRHSETLKELELVGAHIAGGTWMSFFRSIAGKLPLLETVRLRGDFWQDGAIISFLPYDYEAVKEGVEEGEGLGGIDISPSIELFTEAMEDAIVDGEEIPNAEDWDEGGDDWE
ncbi:hypothetical protein B0A55_10557 [Friedmanniomyces simplex]|uniref:Uncharacterized protein n=1 Tax=Friedmanniomyces simplex TaxID=329884 RepID=A0A4U0WR94_9PEZI|nr:hypothetical protein B0A55_10557 [Friedmanniomyces simplex]